MHLPIHAVQILQITTLEPEPILYHFKSLPRPLLPYVPDVKFVYAGILGIDGAEAVVRDAV